MSIKKLMLILPLLIASISGAFYLFPKAKKNKLNHPPVLQSQFGGHGVVDRIIKMTIQEDHIAKTDTESVKIKVSLQLPFDLNEDLHFKWILAENIKLDAGSLEGLVSNIKAHTKRDIEISVFGFSQIENRQVAFQVWGFKDGRKIFADGIVASKKEKTFENIVQNVERLKAERSQE